MLRRAPFYPFLFSAYLALSMLVSNFAEVSPASVWRPMIWLLLLATGMLAVFAAVTRDWQRAGYLTFLWLVFLFVYGHLYHFAYRWLAGFNPVFLRVAVLFAWLAAVVLLSSRTAWRVLKPEKIIPFVNVFIGILLVFSLVLLSVELKDYYADPILHWQRPPVLSERGAALAGNEKPDIYYIVLDSYSRADVLADLFAFDNRPFLESLKSRGFYIAGRSSSNYMQTALSLAASLNMNYLDELSVQGEESYNRQPLKELIAHSRVRSSLEANGYKTIAINSGYSYTEVTDADLYLTSFVRINELEQLILSATPLIILADWIDLRLPLLTHSVHRERIQDTLGWLSEMPSLPGPKFVFVHIVAPHPPFVFGAAGEPVEPPHPFTLGDISDFPGTEEEYSQGYVGELQFLNSRLVDVIDHIITDSSQEPIIILQGDHGQRLGVDLQDPDRDSTRTALAILAAYYLPSGGAAKLYDDISPVNSFRVVFNHYYGTNYPLLQDEGYFSSFDRPYQFQPVDALRSAGR